MVLFFTPAWPTDLPQPRAQAIVGCHLRMPTRSTVHSFVASVTVDMFTGLVENSMNTGTTLWLASSARTRFLTGLESLESEISSSIKYLCLFCQSSTIIGGFSDVRRGFCTGSPTAHYQPHPAVEVGKAHLQPRCHGSSGSPTALLSF